MTAAFDQHFAEHLAVAEATRAALAEPFARLVAACVASVRAGGKILFYGNGGSASDAQHLATELIVRFSKDRDPIAALSLSTDTSALTAIGNDLGFDKLFSRQIEALGRPGDVAIALTTSGKSPNITLAAQQAHKMGLVSAGFGGKGGGDLVGLVDPYLVVPSTSTARIQEMHITLGHLLCGALEHELGLI